MVAAAGAALGMDREKGLVRRGFFQLKGGDHGESRMAAAGVLASSALTANRENPLEIGGVLSNQAEAARSMISIIDSMILSLILGIRMPDGSGATSNVTLQNAKSHYAQHVDDSLAPLWQAISSWRSAASDSVFAPTNFGNAVQSVIPMPTAAMDDYSIFGNAAQFGFQSDISKWGVSHWGLGTELAEPFVDDPAHTDTR